MVRGRGATSNPANRFERLTIEREAWSLAVDSSRATEFLVDSSRTIVARNSSPDVGFDASVNRRSQVVNAPVRRVPDPGAAAYPCDGNCEGTRGRLALSQVRFRSS